MSVWGKIWKELWKQLPFGLFSMVSFVGIKMDHSQFYLINLSPDPSMNEMLVYYLRSEETKVLG